MSLAVGNICIIIELEMPAPSPIKNCLPACMRSWLPQLLVNTHRQFLSLIKTYATDGLEARTLLWFKWRRSGEEPYPEHLEATLGGRPFPSADLIVQ